MLRLTPTLAFLMHYKHPHLRRSNLNSGAHLVGLVGGDGAGQRDHHLPQPRDGHRRAHRAGRRCQICPGIAIHGSGEAKPMQRPGNRHGCYERVFDLHRSEAPRDHICSNRAREWIAETRQIFRTASVVASSPHRVDACSRYCR